MENNSLNLSDTKHPNEDAEKHFKQLIGIDHYKESLLNSLALFLNTEGGVKWQKCHHPKGLDILDLFDTGTPLVILSGEVGCGKTALAQSIATPLSKKLDNKIFVFETPSNIRGSGLVGEISNRITATFDMVKRKLKNDTGILIIDEGDDLATSRSQNQAHHEDRAGLNVLIKQLDLIKREKVKLAVILITNRLEVLDPAIRRRASLELVFERPNEASLRLIFQNMFEGVKYEESDFEDLCQIALSQTIPFTYSDLIQKVGKQALIQSISNNIPFTIKEYMNVLERTEASPLIIKTEFI